MNLTLTGFNGATSARSWKSAGVLAPLPIALASMGPRARARGNTAANIQGINENALQWGHERALVEIPLTTEEKAEVLELQWGHERALVEITSVLVGLNIVIKLQWGHERALVEIGIAGRPRICPRRFTGATSARSWK